MPSLLRLFSCAITRRLSREQRAFILTVAIGFVCASIMAIVFGILQEKEESIWSNYKSVKCEEYCENHHECQHEMQDRPAIQQPVNAWTNLAYLVVGIWPVLAYRVDISTVTFCLANIYLCIGSFMFHASITQFWAHMDVAGMYTVLASVVGHGLHAVTGLSWRCIVVPILVLAILVPFFKPDMDDVKLNSTTMTIICGSLIAVFTAILVVARIIKILKPTTYSFQQEQQQHQETCQDYRVTATTTRRCQSLPTTKWLEIGKLVLVAFVPAFMFSAAVVIRAKDKDKSWCNPESIVQGHGAWHCLTATATLFIWLFFDKNHLADILEAQRQQLTQAKEVKGENEDTVAYKDDQIVHNNLSAKSTADTKNEAAHE